MQTNTRQNRVRKLTVTAMLAAIASILIFLAFPVGFAPSFLKLDFSEVPVLIGTFAYGPIAGVAIELVKAFVNLILNDSGTGGVGELAMFLIGSSFALTAGFIYKFKKTLSGAILAMAAGTIVMVLAGCLLNVYVLLPAYGAAFHLQMNDFIDMGKAVNNHINTLFRLVLLAIAPFNLLKGVVVSVITGFLYKRISPVMHKGM